MHLPVLVLGLLIFSISATLIWIGSSTYGSGLTTDSFSYINAAVCFRSDFRFCDGTIPFTQWPPVFPAVLSLLGDSFEEISYRASYLQSVLFGILSLSTFLCLREISEQSNNRDWLGFFGSLLVVTSFPIFRVGIMVWSELLFILVSLGALFLVYRYIKEGGYKLFWVATILSMLPPLTRYIGITVSISGALGILLLHRESFKERFTKAGIYCLASLVPLGIWCIRNINLVGVPFGPRQQSNLDLSTLFFAVTSALSEWWSGGNQALLALLATLFLIPIARNSLNAFSKILLIWVGVYLLFLGTLSLTMSFDPVSNRLLASIAAPLLIIVASMLSQASGIKLKILSGGILIWWFIFIIPTLNFEVARAYYDGAGGYQTRIWQNSETYSYLKNYPVNEPTFTNADEFLSATFGKRFDSIPQDIEEMNAIAANGHVALVFFKYSWRRLPYSLGSITPTPKVRRAFSDGELLIW